MKVKFVPQNVEFEIKPGESVMHVAQDHGLYIKSVCKGVPSCAECRCRVVEGEHNVLPPNSEELSLIGTGHFIDHRRLSCQLKCFGDITVDLTEQIEKQQLGGKKSKGTLTKDDRVEEQHAIRSNEGRERVDRDSGAEEPDTTDETGGTHETEKREQTRPPQRQSQPRGPQKPGQPQPARGGAQRDPTRNQNRGPQVEGVKGGEGGGKRRRRRRGGRGGGGAGGENGGSGDGSGPRS